MALSLNTYLLSENALLTWTDRLVTMTMNIEVPNKYVIRTVVKGAMTT